MSVTSSYAVFQKAAGATGNGHPFRVEGLATMTFDVVISASATVTFEAAGNSENWVALPATNVASGVTATTATASGLYRAVTLGLARVRARVSTFGSGTISVTGIGVESAVAAA